MNSIKTKSRHKIYEDQWLKFFQDEVEFQDGSQGTYAWMDRKPGVAIVAINSKKLILLQQEDRYVVNKQSWEIPGGGIDDGETAEQAALREIKEETGLTCDHVQKIGIFYPLNSCNKETVTVFVTEINGVQLTNNGQEVSEGIGKQKWLSFDEIFRMIDNGEIDDAMTIASLQIAIRRFSK